MTTLESPFIIKELVWNLWQDEVGRFEQVHIHFIRPQPTRELGAEGVIILLIEILCEEIPPASSPALAVTCDTSHRLMDSPKALYVDRAVDVPSLLPHFGLSYLCAPQGFRQCAFTVASASIGAYFAPVPEGALIKMTVGAKLRIFAQAFEWFPDLERFATVVREQVRRGVQDHGLVFHCLGVPPARFGFRIGQLLHPPQLRDDFQQICGDAIQACYPVDHDALNAMLGRANGDFHALVYLQGQPLEHAFLVVTGCDELRQDGCRTVVCLRDSHSDLRALHLHLCGIDDVEHQAMRHDDFMFQHEGRLVYDLYAIPFGAVILHSVLQAPQEDEVIDEDERRNGAEDLFDDLSDDGLSLLQLHPGMKSIKLLQFGHPMSDFVISHAAEDVERCTIISMLPSRFAELQEWSSRCQVYCDDGLQDVELLVDHTRRDGVRDLISKARCLEVLRLPRSCTGHEFRQMLCSHFSCAWVNIDSVRIYGVDWPVEAVHHLEDGDVCNIQFLDIALDALQPQLSPRSVPVPCTEHIYTFVADLQDSHRRLDVVACNEAQACAQAASAFSVPILLTHVGWDPSHLESCRSLFVVSWAEEDGDLWPTLFALELTDAQQAWQVCYLDPLCPWEGICQRFPKACSFPLFANGRALNSHSTLVQEGTCIVCDSEVKEDPSTTFPFTDGMQRLLLWMSAGTAPVAASTGTSGGEGGAAPCQTDRWCAAPPSHASSKRHDGNRIRVGQAGGPDYTEDNSGLCSDRHNLPGASTAVPISLEAVLPPSDRLCSTVC